MRAGAAIQVAVIPAKAGIQKNQGKDRPNKGRSFCVSSNLVNATFPEYTAINKQQTKKRMFCKVFLGVSTVFFAMPFFVSAQGAIVSQPTPPVFMENVKSQADFDKLAPDQKEEASAYIEAMQKIWLSEVADASQASSGPELPSFMKNVKSQADFDKLEPEQKERMKSYLSAKAIADAAKVVPEGEFAMKSMPTPLSAPENKMMDTKNILFGLVALLFFVAVGLIAVRKSLFSKSGQWFSGMKSILFLGLIASGMMVFGGVAKAAPVSWDLWSPWNPSLSYATITLGINKSSYAPGETIVVNTTVKGNPYNGYWNFPVNVALSTKTMWATMGDPSAFLGMVSTAVGAPGVVVSNTFNVTAPATPGNYTLYPYACGNGVCYMSFPGVIPITVADKVYPNCGTAAGVASTTAPAANLCVSGANVYVAAGPNLDSGNSRWVWTCQNVIDFPAASVVCLAPYVAPAPLPTASVTVAPDPVSYGGNPGFTLSSTNAVYCQVALDGPTSFTEGFFASGTYNPGSITTAGSHAAWVNCYNSDWVSSGWSVTNFTVNNLPDCGQVTDARDGNIYDTVVIGTQCWMRENMNIGTRIDAGIAQTNNSVIEKYCYNNDSNNCTSPHPTYPDGGLYLWDEAMQYSTVAGAQGICPAGWHIPTDAEWYTLENYLKDTGQPCGATRDNVYECSTAGTKLKPGGSSGFEGNLTGGIYTGSFFRDGLTYYWTSSKYNTGVWYRGTGVAQSGIWRNWNIQLTNGHPVRCLQGAGVVPPANTLQLCRDGVPIAQGGGTYDFSLQTGSTTNIKAYYDSDITSGHQCDAGSTDVTASVTFTETNPTGGALSLSANGTNPRVFTGASSGTETVTITHSGQTATMNATVTCVETVNCTAEQASVCTGSTIPSGTTKTGTCGSVDCSGQAGTRYCDFNWKEVTPGQ